jgi:hypothetical protein
LTKNNLILIDFTPVVTLKIHDKYILGALKQILGEYAHVPLKEA